MCQHTFGTDETIMKYNIDDWPQHAVIRTFLCTPQIHGLSRHSPENLSFLFCLNNNFLSRGFVFHSVAQMLLCLAK